MKLFRCSSLLFLTAVFLSSLSPCLGAESPAHPVAKTGPTFAEQDLFLTSILQKIANYSQPGIGVDENTGLPLDHIRIDPESNLTWGQGAYTAASKVAPYILFLLKLYQAEGFYSQVHLIPSEAELSALEKLSVAPNNQTLALIRMQRALDTIETMISQDELTGAHLGGMMAWASIYPDGKVLRDKNLVPLLDNGLLSWAYAAILGALDGNKDPMVQNVHAKVQALLDKQDYSLFFDSENLRFFREIDVTSGKGNPKSHLDQFWTEDLLAVLWGLLKTPMSNEIRTKTWNNLNGRLAEWKTSQGEVMDIPLGPLGSNHEIMWSLFLLPARQTPLYPLLYNSQYAQADFAVQNSTPGFLATGYDALGAYTRMGVPSAAQHPELIQRTDCAVVFATAGALAAGPNAAKDWLIPLIRDQRLLTEFGPLESVGPGGRADILSADSQYILALALSGGTGKDVSKYLSSAKVAGGDITCLAAFNELMQQAVRRMLAARNLKEIRSPKQPFPTPPQRDYSAEPMAYTPQTPTFDILKNIMEGRQDDRHGAGVSSVLGRNMRWEITEGLMLVNYDIPVTASDYTRFAWWGTYLDTNRPYLAGFTHLRVTVPNDGKPHRFNIMLKREDTTIVQPIALDTRQPGVVSEDEQWKTYTFPLKHRRRFAHLPLTYIAFSVDDPVRNPEFPASDSVVVKSLVLVNANQPQEEIDVRAAMEAVGRLPEFTPRPHRPSPLPGAIQPRWASSGSIGGSTEDLSRETPDGALYFEFDNVGISNGFSGVWGSFDASDLRECHYLILDVIAGPAGPAPNLLRVECKTSEGLTESVLCSWNVDLAALSAGIIREQWTRLVLPMPRMLSSKPAHILAFVYENYMGGLPSGSLEISPPSFLFSEPSTFAENGQPLVRLSPPANPAQSIPLLPWWQILKGEASADVKFSAAPDQSQVELTGNGGWFGARLYPSFLALALGDTLTIEIEPLSEAPCTGVVEIKGGRTPHVKTAKFSVTRADLAEGEKTAKVTFPLPFRSPRDNVDYIALSGIRGHYRVHDIRTYLKAEERP